MLLRPTISTAIRHSARPSSTICRRLPLPQNRSFALLHQSPISRSTPLFPSQPRPLQGNDAHFRPISTSTRAAIEKAVSSAPVVLFMKGTPDTPQCGFSRASIQILGLQGVDPEKFTAFNVLEDEELRQGIKEYSDWPTIPQLYVDKEFVGGCDILMSMHQNGELAKMLEEKDVLVAAEATEKTES